MIETKETGVLDNNFGDFKEFVKNIEERTFIINFMKKYSGMYVNWHNQICL